MISLIIYWIMLSPLFLGLGVLLHTIIDRYFKLQEDFSNVFVFVLLGVAVVGLIANVSSFFVPLGDGPFLFATIYGFSLLGIYYKRHILVDSVKQISSSKIQGVVFLLILFVVVCKSASPSEILDEKGYYLPFIKWIEIYGTTPGLANLQGRFGFNSSWHILSALVSLRWSGMLFYDLNGFIILIIIGYYLLGVSTTSAKMRYACGLFVSAFIFRNFLTSSAADLPNIYFTSLVLLWMIEKYEKKTLGEIDYTFIVSFIISFYLITIKPSSIYLLLIYLPTIVVALTNKRFNKIIWLICIGLVFIIPWCLRFYITTGYLVFPVPGIDLFNPDWKLSQQTVIVERNVVKCFPISDTLPMEAILKMSFVEWFPQWFKKSVFEQKVFFIAVIFVTLYYIIRIKKYLYNLNDRLFIVFQGILLLNYIIWLTQYPDFRFAWGFILVYVFIGLYFIAQEWAFFRTKLQALTLFFLIAMTSLNVFKTLKDVSVNYKNILIQQAPFPIGHIQVEKIHEVSYYKSDQTWDMPLPSILWWQHPDIVLRDSTLKGGFRTVKP